MDFMKFKIDKLFFANLFIIYYWFIFNLIDYSSISGSISWRYILIVCPIVLFCFFGLVWLAQIEYHKLSLILAVYLFLLLLLSLLKNEICSFFTMAIFCIPIIIIFNCRIHVSLKVINVLFILSIIVSVLSYHIGINQYGYLPGQTSLNLHQGLFWRVSLFPYSGGPHSAAFALLVLVVNYFRNDSKSKYIFFILSFYFILLSGSRTMLLAFCAIIGFVFIVRRPLRIKVFLSWVYPLIIVLFLFLIIFSPTLILRFNFDNNVINSFLYHRTQGVDSIESTGIQRLQMYNAFFKLFLNNPIRGASTKELQATESILQAGSETLLISTLARDGFIAIVFTSFFFYLFTISIGRKNNLSYSISIIILLSAMFYSSFLKTYNFIFLLMLMSFFIPEIKHKTN